MADRDASLEEKMYKLVYILYPPTKALICYSGEGALSEGSMGKQMKEVITITTHSVCYHNDCFSFLIIINSIRKKYNISIVFHMGSFSVNCSLSSYKFPAKAVPLQLL